MLFNPYRIGKLELKNRVMRSATWDALADTSGAVTDASVALYQKLGQGGIGLIVTGFAYVSSLGQAVYGQYGIHTDDMIPGLRRLAKVAHKGDAKIAIQIVHSGSNSRYLLHRDKTTLAVSVLKETDKAHIEMNSETIEMIISEFAMATVRAREAGFDAVQLHGAHGYLMSQFLSPLSNQRTDQWGGNTENRRRFHLEVIRKIRKLVGDDFPLMIKFGVQDNKHDGLSLGEGLETARQMVHEGIDAIEVSGSGRDSVRIMREGDTEKPYFRETAAAVKQTVKVPVAVVGGIRSIETANNILDAGEADLISMCRPFIREPDLVLRWSRGDKNPAKCISCNKCLRVMGKEKSLVCVGQNE